MVIKRDPPRDSTVEIACDNADAFLLLRRAREFYPEALPFIQIGLTVCET